MKSGAGRVIVSLVVTLIVGFLYFYVNLPALNLHAKELYFFIGLLCVVYIFCTLVTSGFAWATSTKFDYFRFVKAQAKIPAVILVALVAAYIVGGVSSSVVFRSHAYRELLTVENGTFAMDVEEVSYDQIPRLDAQSAIRLGDRKMGELSDMVSQFEVNNAYTQINYNGSPVRVTYLDYGDFFKWLNNRSSGIPAYIILDMVTQEVEVGRLSEGIKYSPSELFARDLFRYVRFHYPTYMFDTPTYEIDEDGVPYWICPRIQKTIGLYGGTDIIGAVMINAVTGASHYYDVTEIPNWVDRVFTAQLIIEQYDYHGKYINGFINSLFGQKGVTVTTDAYNYIALKDDVYMYTGITSVSGDQSNVGFILSNQRTKETRYYASPGAEEFSAMSSAQGVVQDLGYSATFPLLLNIDGQPTYFMALKDSASLVKMYAMVNEQQYQIVATGTTVAACEQAYQQLLVQNNIIESTTLTGDMKADGTIAEIRTAVIDGTSFYFFRLEGIRCSTGYPWPTTNLPSSSTRATRWRSTTANRTGWTSSRAYSITKK
jgi:hypothetical protein